MYMIVQLGFIVGETRYIYSIIPSIAGLSVNLDHDEFSHIFTFIT